ncbi:hypothetical protein BMS3Abin17_00102 [archaeon BMS3Abin17]|nr:hypothetical protein BMS3Abin17_00102 [archaeon BMS3Abin17]HDZ60154.1 hypothetical protein [Candidatus Pacearchaeota archaeon]
MNKGFWITLGVLIGVLGCMGIIYLSKYLATDTLKLIIPIINKNHPISIACFIFSVFPYQKAKTE